MRSGALSESEVKDLVEAARHELFHSAIMQRPVGRGWVRAEGLRGMCPGLISYPRYTARSAPHHTSRLASPRTSSRFGLGLGD